MGAKGCLIACFMLVCLAVVGEEAPAPATPCTVPAVEAAETPSALGVEYPKTPREVVKTSIDKGLEVLKSADYAGDENKAKRHERIRQIMLAVTDMDLVVRLSLRRHVDKFSEEDLKEFKEAFSQLLFSTYIGHVELYSGEGIAVEAPKPMSETKVVVPAIVATTDNKEIPIEFSMRETEGLWKMYDVKIEGVSLVKNYRSQFNDFLVNKSPRKLIQKLEEKVAENEKNS